ncbi:hypothetical protein ACA910_018690 [Epithemia clementina (nom. ined.)]
MTPTMATTAAQFAPILTTATRRPQPAPAALGEDGSTTAVVTTWWRRTSNLLIVVCMALVALNIAFSGFVVSVSGGGGGRGQGNSSRGLYHNTLLLGSILEPLLTVSNSTTNNDDDKTSASLPQPTNKTKSKKEEDFPRTFTAPNGWSMPLCPNLDQYFDPNELETALTKAHEFHVMGGSLKSVQLFKDSAMDETIAKMGLRFIPNNNNNNNNNKDPQAQPTLPLTDDGKESFTSYLRNYYESHYDSRGGYGRPLPGSFDNPKHPGLMAGRWFDVREKDGGRLKWDASLGPIGPTHCRRWIQLGPPAGGTLGVDGTKWFCAAAVDTTNNKTIAAVTHNTTIRSTTRQPPPAQQEQQALRRATTTTTTETPPLSQHQAAAEKEQPPEAECHILSIGGNDNWKFEIAVREQLGCITHTFDCTLRDGRPRRKPNDDKVKFYNSCIDGKTHTDAHGRHYLNYHDLLDQAGLLAEGMPPPLALKLDVEGFEYDIFTQMIQQSSQQQPLPQQILVELHWGTRMTGLDWMPRVRTSGEIALMMNMMFQGGGYLPILQDFSPGCGPCMEVVFFKVLCPSLVSSPP